MPRLRDLQTVIGRVVLDRSEPALAAAALLDDRPVPAAARLLIHRNNTLLGLIDPLAASFPVVRQLVGEDFFAQMAGAFIRACPPSRPDLLSYGQELAAFIAGYAPAASVPYLADMARLEYAIHVIGYHAADYAPLDPKTLESFPQDRLEDLRLAPHPSLRFVASEFPLLQIWQAHQEGGDLDRPIGLDEGGVMLLVYRPRRESLLRPVSAASFTFTMALAAGQNLSGAYQSALAADPEFPITSELAALLAGEVFVEASLP